MRPTTGSGSLRKAAASFSTSRPLRRAPADGRIEIPALGSRSIGYEPLPIWLRH
jgi:hypothetical protein